MKNNLKEFYDKRVKVYDAVLTTGSLYEIIYNFIGEKEKVLDVGCANGNFSGQLKKKKAKVTGIEVSPILAKNSAKLLDKVIVGNIETMSFSFKKRSFDTILVMDVLEHLFDPVSVLTKLNPYLNQNGKVIVSVPNVANWFVRLELLQGRFNSESTTILEEGHIRFFTYATAKKMFDKAEFKIKKFDLVINYPLVLLKIHNRFPFLGIDNFLKSKLPKLFAFQFIFELQRK